MVGHAVLRKVVGADFFGAIAGFDLAAAFDGERGLPLFLLLFVQARAKNAHGLGAILDLGFLVLLGNHQTARNVRYAHGRIRGVDRLTARAGRTEGIDAQILRFNLYVDFVGLGEHRNSRGRSMDAALGFRRWHALDAVHAALVFQFRIHFLTLNGGDDFFQTAQRRRRAFEDFNFPALRFRVARVHAKKFRGKEGRFIAAGTGANFQNDALLVEGIFRQKQKLQFALGFFFARRELPFLVVCHLFHFSVFRFHEHLVRAGEILFELFVLAVLLDNFLEFSVLLGDFLVARGVGSHFGSRELLRQLVVTRAELI